jgi:ferredoxin
MHDGLETIPGSNVEAALLALQAAAAVPMPDVPFVHIESSGTILVYGRDEIAIEAGELLKQHLDVTVLIMPPGMVGGFGATDFPVVKGKIAAAKGHFGAFNLVVDDFAQPEAGLGDGMRFGLSRNGAQSRCDVILDLSGGSPLFSTADLRDGYLRVDPGNRSAVLEAVLKARNLTGAFEKPRYLSFDASLCAHSRSNIVGCRRCLDLCPAGAIQPAGDHVAIDPNICAGCGQCAAVCPTGAASYAMLPPDVLVRKLRMMLLAYRTAGGMHPVVLFHDEAHGSPMLDALAQLDDGLPAYVLPFAVNETTQVGLEGIVAGFAYGASAIRLLLRGRPGHDVSGLRQTVALAEPILQGLGFAGPRLAMLETDDPDVVGVALREIPSMPSAPRPASFQPTGGRREVLRFALRELHRAAHDPVEVIALPKGAPFGAVEVDADGCTLCLSCVSACPTGALRDDPERPMLRFVEGACVQCGLCQVTCPERVITLKPQVDFRAVTAPARVLKQQEPFCCIQCGKPFGVKSTIDRVVAKLEGRHWMYTASSRRTDLIKMCEDCRVAVVSEGHFDPYGAPDRVLRTTDDYLREGDIDKRGPRP